MAGPEARHDACREQGARAAGLPASGILSPDVLHPIAVKVPATGWRFCLMGHLPTNAETTWEMRLQDEEDLKSQCWAVLHIQL